MKTHRLGDHGDDVGLLQRRLMRAGFPVDVTHVYDEATEAAVRAIQKKTGLVDDGIAGPKTLAAIATGRRDPKHLANADIVRAEDALGVPVACVRAVNEVESTGLGFLSDGRPKILFERHIFWKRLEARGIDPAPIATKYPNICSQTTGGYQGGAAEYMRLAAAELIDAGAAYESASWGAFQVMGFHWERLGYSSVDDFVARMENGEGDQLDAFVRFVAADTGLVAALKGRKWAVFARGYNGPNFARNLYDVKLARAFDREGGRMNAFAVKLIAGAAAIALLACGALYVRALRAELADAKGQLTCAGQAVAGRDSVIGELRQDARDKAQQQQQLDASTDKVATKLAAAREEIRTVIHENPTVRSWADTPLLDDVVRLSASPAYTGADDFSAAVPADHALHAAGDGAAQ
ncbi:hypothetical protein DFQ28_004624 [Apophysomyces sp. BC1034]|nr:hypothetical protein DFQ28_004624 [Apophysomyces sp. BC1034]